MNKQGKIKQGKKTYICIKEEISLLGVKNFIINLLLFIYPLYWLIRFIIWAIKTLKGKQNG